MTQLPSFVSEMQQAYRFASGSIFLGAGMFQKQVVPEVEVRAPLKTFNRHGLIAGATGTGKTKSLQMMAEQLAMNGVSVLLMDIKGDLSGIAKPGAHHPKIEERYAAMQKNWSPVQNAVELLSISKEPGTPLRATVSEFGPVLLSKILEINDTQSGALSLLFKYCDDKALPLLDLNDLRKALQYISNEGKEEIERDYGLVASASVGAILRNMIQMEEQGAEMFFGEPSFEVEDLIQIDDKGRGRISVLRLADIQGKPRLFSTFMLCLMAEIYHTLPERGDVDAPELVLFLDEAHLIFKEAPKVLLEQIETMVKLIRSKGVGIFFITQNPTDIPDAVLSQLGFKLQHALRAFTAKDRKDIQKAAENYPESGYYQVEDELTQLGIGEAFITVLNEKGIPTPLVHTMMASPGSRMDVLTPDEMQQLVAQSSLYDKYHQTLDRESAFEILSQKLARAREEEKQEDPKNTKEEKPEKSVIEQAVNSSVGRTIVRELTRGLLGVLGLGGSRTRTRKRNLF